MGIPTWYLPDDSPNILYSYNTSLNFVLDDLINTPSIRGTWSPYEQAVYNLAGHLLITYAGDQTYAISSLSWAAGTVTVTTTASNMIQPGDALSIVGVSPLGYSGSVLNGVRQTSIIVNATPDNTHFSYPLTPNPGIATPLANAAANEQFFVNARKLYKINSFVPGVVTSANDLSTGAGLLNPDFMKGLTLADLQLLKTPFGRTYLSIAQDAGPNWWGVS